MPVTMETGSKACASDEPPPPGTAGQALGPMTAMVLIFAGVEREQVVLVLEQGDALQRALKRYGAIGDGVGGVRGVELGAVEEAVAQLSAEEAQQLVVDGGFLDGAVVDGGEQGLGIHEARAGHLEVEAVVGGADACRRSRPSRT